jgi:S-adenosylmethionine:tRNA ribosyltransferase-isomerase
VTAGAAPGDRTSDYDYDLPDRLIAQHPGARRDESRLLVVHRASGRLEHRTFRDLAPLLAPGDALVVNTTRVFRARLLGTRDGSGAPAEVLLLRERGDGRWEAMVSPGAKLKPGRRVHVADGFAVVIEETTAEHHRVVRLETAAPPHEAIARFGHVPLPPYVHRPDEPTDEERYQTVYARETGSVAAPTAGLHFTPAVLDAVAARGVRRVEVLLHVGAGTFRPVAVEDPAAHVMHREWCQVQPEAAAALVATRAAGGRVVAVGTTAMRTLETAARDGVVAPFEGDTDLFIRPGFRFHAVDALLTNFHLPRSTLLMLVAAFAGYDVMRAAYAEAVRAEYRFYSYGDAMVVV